MVVPLFPAFRTLLGSSRPLNPGDRIHNLGVSGDSPPRDIFSTETPKALRHLRVERQSPLSEKLSTTASPGARLLRMAARCDMDLSAGVAMVPSSFLAGWTTCFMDLTPRLAILVFVEPVHHFTAAPHEPFTNEDAGYALRG